VKVLPPSAAKHCEIAQHTDRKKKLILDMKGAGEKRERERQRAG